MRKIGVFFTECYQELKRVTWPSRPEVGRSTRIVLVSVTIFALVLGFIDLILLQLIDLLF